jgi:hypothetical protein
LICIEHTVLHMGWIWFCAIGGNELAVDGDNRMSGYFAKKLKIQGKHIATLVNQKQFFNYPYSEL